MTSSRSLYTVGQIQKSSGVNKVIFRPFFQDGGRPPSWICDARAWTTHEEYLVVFIAVQNLVGIGIVVLKICEFQYYSNLA